jgi:ATP-binding cassette, subfamily F, member 3
MSIITAHNLSLSFGAFDVFKGISVTTAADSKIGLIGPNGIGKTSMLLMLAGIIQPTTGTIHIARGRRLGYLRQEAVDAFGSQDNTVYAEMLSVFSQLREQQNRLHEMEERMSQGDYSEELLQEYGDLQEAFDQAGGYDYEVRINQTLQGLGLGPEQWEMPLNILSGGQKTRALLARLLLEKPDLLMLDEPTNHMDLEAVEWLEKTLSEWEGAVIIVSHDRYFLDNTVSTIWEMNRSGVEVYSGDYSAYLLQRQERWEYYERVFNEEKARLLKEVDFIQRNWVRASTHARAMGLLRRISRDIAIVEHFGIMGLRNGKKWSEQGLSVERPLDPVEAVRAVNAIQMTSSRPPQLKPRLASANTSGNQVLRVEKAVIGYPGNSLFEVEELELRRGECAALIGPNGSGKTTFLKVLLGQLQPLDGEVRLGSSLKIGYFAQAHDALKGERSVLDELLQHKEMHPGAARGHLAQYLFRDDDVFKPLSALSGGERARLALAILALEGTNYLLLDEPTNHIDIPAREALQDVLSSYAGTILLVSHDRYLIDRLATQIWDLRDGKLTVFKGRYREFVLHGLKKAPPTNGKSAPSGHRLLLSDKPLQRDNSKETKRRQQALAQIEERIREQERAVQRLSSELQKNRGKSYEQLNKLSWQVAQAQARLEDLMQEWESLAA